MDHDGWSKVQDESKWTIFEYVKIWLKKFYKNEVHNQPLLCCYRIIAAYSQCSLLYRDENLYENENKFITFVKYYPLVY